MATPILVTGAASRAAERTGIRQEQCGDIQRGGKSGLNVYGRRPDGAVQLSRPR